MCAKSKEDKEAKKAAAAAAKAEKAKGKAKPKKKQSAGANEYNFFLLHGEKVGIGVAVLIFGAVVAMGSGLKPFTLTPDQINQASSRADDNIKNSKVPPVEYDESVVNFDYNNYAKLIKSGVKVNSYETPTRWESSLFPDKVKRPNVKPLPLENLKAVASIGAISYKEISASGNANAGGGMGGGAMGGGMGGMGGMGSTGELKGRKWVTVTGSIPIRKQQEAYNSLFGTAQYTDDIRDQPRYIYYRLERGVVAPNGGQTEWEEINVIRAIRKENNQWSGIGSDQVGYSYMAPTVAGFPPMAMSCPPMQNKPFGEEVANLPNIPLNSTDQIQVQADQLKEWNELQDSMNEFNESDLLNRDPFSDARMGGAGLSGGMTGMAGGMGGGLGGGMDMGGMGGGMDMGGGMAGGMTGGMGGGMDAQGASWMKNQNALIKARMKIQQASSVEYYLFRYFDFEVDPDKTYVYRVKLLLANPNYGVEERFVEDPSTLEQRYVESDFSQISNPVSLGEASRIFAKKVSAASKDGAEPSIQIASVYFDVDGGQESIVNDISVKRGQVANFYGQSHDPVNVSGSMGGGMDMMMEMGGGAGSKRGAKQTKKTVNHVSNVCIVDALGGTKISAAKDYNSPGKILILEPNGLMRVREIKEDARELNRYEGGGMGMGMGGFGAGAAGMMM